MNTRIIQAIKEKKYLQFHYDGGTRFVEPHCYGISTAGNECIRAYQTDGYSKSKEMGWKMFDLSKASSIVIMYKNFQTRPDYKQGDKGMKDIFAEV